MPKPAPKVREWGIAVTRIAIIGAGPYGLSLAAHLGAAGVEHRIFGPAMDTWRHHVPAGMLLKSDGFASSLSEPSGRGTLAAYCGSHGIPYHPTDLPVPLDVFNAYATDFQRQFVPHLEEREVLNVQRSAGEFVIGLDDGETLTAEVVVGAIGISHFAVVPDELAGLPSELCSHSSTIHDLSAFSGKRVTVVGAGASAVDIATLMAEAGATVSLVARGEKIKFFSEPQPGPRTRWQRVKAPSSGIGPGWRSWACQNLPQFFRFLPGDARVKIVKRHLGPSSAFAMKARFEAGVTPFLGKQIDTAREDGEQVRLIVSGADGVPHEIVSDHIVAATGYRPDVTRLSFFTDDLRTAIRTHQRMPVVSGSFESSVPGLYFIGPPAANSFGPLMRFMVGAEYVAPLVARRLGKSVGRVTRDHAVTNA